MQQTLPHGPLDAWFMVAEQILQSGDRSLLGGWLRVWIGNGKLIHAMACVCRAFKPFRFPVCPLCRRTWTYDGSFSHGYFMPMCRERVVQANTCFLCHRATPCFPNRVGVRQRPLWRRECLYCGRYMCTHPEGRLPESDFEQSSSCFSWFEDEVSEGVMQHVSKSSSW